VIRSIFRGITKRVTTAIAETGTENDVTWNTLPPK
jgi:hypothetical protein